MPLLAWMAAPPSSSFVSLTPRARSTKRRPADHDLRGVARHHREVRRHEAAGGKARHRPGGHRHYRHGAHRIGDDAKARRCIDRFANRAAAPAAAFDAAAATFQRAHQRHLVLHRQVFGVDALAQAGGIRRTTLQGEVLAAHHQPPTVDAAEAHHIVRGYESGQPVVIVVVRDGGGQALLLEGARIEQGVDALADGESAASVLLGDALFAALLLGQLGDGGEAPELPLPSSWPDHVSKTATT